MSRINYYQSVHKAVRRLLFLFSIELGRIDFASEKQMDLIENQFNKINAFLEDHAHHEDTHLHPFMVQYFPEEIKALESEHHKQHGQLLEIKNLIHKIKIEKSMQAKQESGSTLYLLWNQFVADYLLHLHQEEVNIMMPLWELCDDATLLGPFMKLVQSIPKEHYIQLLPDFLPAISRQEREALLAGLTLEERCQHLLTRLEMSYA